jgi:hypothetical protein
MPGPRPTRASGRCATASRRGERIQPATGAPLFFPWDQCVHRALALTTRGAWPTGERTTRAEAARLALERCAEHFQRPCLLLAVDGLLTTQIPKSRPVIRIFLPSTETEIPPRERERIGQIYRGPEWRALAKGKNGSWHAVAGAASETAGRSGYRLSITARTRTRQCGRLPPWRRTLRTPRRDRPLPARPRCRSRNRCRR